MDPLAEAIIASAARIGANPVDLATAISYETAGTFDPWKQGPTTQWGQHAGLIQWGEPQRKQYGVYQGMPVDAQMRAVEKYLLDAGFLPGMGMMDMYSAINAGQVGRYGASDANNGGAPGTVADKVNLQMGGHRDKAMALLGGLTGPAGGPIPPSGPPPLSASFGAPVPQADPFASLLMQQSADMKQKANGQAEEQKAKREALLGGVGAMFR